MELPQVTEGFSPPSELELVPGLPALRELIPGGGLRPGTVTTVEGSVALALALAAGLENEWFAIVGMPDANMTAVAGLRGEAADGQEAVNVLLLDAPGPRWADVVPALVEACALVLVRPPESPANRTARLARQHGCALIANGPSWAARSWDSGLRRTTGPG